MATYSDPLLQPWGPSLQFCFDESRLREPVRGTVRQLAKQLRRDKAARVVVVGHGDHEGTCRYNDALGLRRANAVRQALIAAGLSPRRIQIASLGERRPLDFASTDEAHALNRRVEILVQGKTVARSMTPGPPAPKCLPATYRSQPPRR